MTLVRDRITAFASGHLIDLTGVHGQDLRGATPRRDSRRDIALALDFAYGIDPAGRRLPLVADRLAPELLRRTPAKRERDDPRWAAIYAAADFFDDGQPNVIMLSDRGPKLTSAPSGLHDRPDVRGNADKEPGRSGVARQTMSTTGRGSRTDDSAPRSGRASASRSAGAASAGDTGSRRQLRTFADDPAGINDGLVVQGATALSPDRLANNRRDEPRFQLRLVGRRPKVGGGVGVVAFWTVFVVAMMFTAVVMWAQNTTRSIQLEKLNQKLAAAESSYTQLRVDVARLQSPQRIESEAKRLGLSTPSNITFIAPDRSVAVSSAR
jgi:cell division protein FtsL